MNNIIILEDDRELAIHYRNILEKFDYEVTIVNNSFDFLNVYRNHPADLLLLDIKLNGSAMNGIQVFQELIDKKLLVSKVIVISGEASRSEIATAMQLGAYTFIEKTGVFNKDKFLADVRQAINLKHQEEKNRSLEQDKETLKNRLLEQMTLVGECPGMQKVKNLITKFAQADIDVLLVGESGTGKEIVANNIYWQSPRAGKPFITVNGSAFPDTLVDSELFGHKKGAFTGADSDKKGYFEKASNGILFLDEICNLNKTIQAKILRAIEYKEIQILGGETKSINTSFFFATNRELENLVAENQFREDLYYRLEGNTIYIPPLRERNDDIILLMDFFFNRYSLKYECYVNVSLKDIKKTLLSYYWPGNVRELEKFCEYLFVVNDVIDNDIIEEQFQQKISGNLKKQDATLHQILKIENYIKAMDILERKFLQYQISQNKGNVSETAEKLGLDRSTLYKKIKKLKID